MRFIILFGLCITLSSCDHESGGKRSYVISKSQMEAEEIPSTEDLH